MEHDTYLGYLLSQYFIRKLVFTIDSRVMMIVASNQECRRTAIHNASRANEAMWQLVDPSQQSLSYIPATTSAGGYARLLRSEVEPADLWHIYAPKPCK